MPCGLPLVPGCVGASHSTFWGGHRLGMAMERYVVSAQRSGPNWFRFCFETFYGHRTPGQVSVIPEADQPDAVFVRTHDALNLTSRSRKKAGGSWTRLDPQEMAGSRVLLLVRHPLETYVRMAERRLPKYLSFISNIRFYCEATGADRHVCYYEDLVASPAAMVEAMAFLGLPPRTGPVPDVATVTARWEELGQASRNNYDRKQAGTGGARTRDAPTDFQYHQRGLDASEVDRVWRFLQCKLSTEGLELIARYAPPEGLAPVRLSDRLKFLRY